MEILIGYVVLCAVVAFMASGRGRSGFGWFLISVIASPLIGLIVLAFLRPRDLRPRHKTAP